MGNFPALQNGLIKPLIAKHPGKIEPTFIPWNMPQKRAGKYDIVIGHSLGGAAALEYADLYNRSPIFITVDPRHMSIASWFDVLIPFLPPFKAPPGSVIFNFYQRGFMSGYPVEGAQRNSRLWSTHVTIPGRKEIAQLVEEFL
jgi:pimeloyl-ACP methyl ester carboxylesterase